jgi:hypothetical protein
VDGEAGLSSGGRGSGSGSSIDRTICACIARWDWSREHWTTSWVRTEYARSRKNTALDENSIILGLCMSKTGPTLAN